MASNKKPQPKAAAKSVKTNTNPSLAAKGLAEKMGPGTASASPIPGLAGLPSGGAAPAPGRRGEFPPDRPDVGRAHESVGMRGAHAMEVPGMPTGQGGNRNPNRVTSSGTRVENSTPEPHNRHNNAEPTNPRYQPDVNQGSGADGRYPNADSGQPPSAHEVMTPDPMHPIGRVPNNPRGETTVPTERAPRPRMY